MNRNLYILLLFCALPFSFLKAQYGNVEFIENKGQWDSRIKFLGEVPAGAFYVQQRGFSVLQRDTAGWNQIAEMMHKHGAKNKGLARQQGLTLRSHLYKVEFLGGNENPELIPDKPLLTYNNYLLGNDPSKWASNCKIYQGITMKNVYPNVDVRYYTNNGVVKYDIIAKPGADISRIALKYEGADKLELKNKELMIRTSVGTLKELSPYSYQPSAKGRQEVSCKYIVENNIVRFDVKGYDPQSTLVIDPSLVFCSFTGSAADNWGFTATYGPDGAMFGGGIVFNVGFPVSPGVVQSIFQGGSGTWPVDMGIIKLTPDGSNRVYATYIGGGNSDVPQSLICDPQGNLIICGRTSSGSSYPSYPDNNIGVSNPGGSFDIVVTKLNALGTGFIGSKRVGGSGDDGANISPFGNMGGAPDQSLQRNYGDEARSEVILDPAGNIYVASCTKSTDFPLVSAFQTTNHGKQDALVLKFPPDVSTLSFSSYMGGSENDAAYVLSVNPTNGMLYVAGGTESTGASAANQFPGNKAGTIGANPFGGIDGFVAVISGTTLVRSTFVGTGGIDQVYGIQFDKFGFPYIMGQTTGSWPHINAAYFDNGAKQFIAKLQPDLSAYVYSTTFGKAAALPSISPTAFLVDRCENVYVSGWGGGFGQQNEWEYPNSGTANLPVTPDAIKSISDNRDFYFFVMKKDAAQILYGSFFGEDNNSQPSPPGPGADHVDGGTSRFDQNGVIYQAICGNCRVFGPANFPTTPGAWATQNGSTSGGACNLALVKIEFNLAGVKAGVQSSIFGVPRDSAGCVPLTVDFRDTIANAVTYEWNFGDGSPTVITNHPDTSHIYNATGTYQVMLVAVDSSTCNIRDTAYMHIRVGDLPINIAFNPVKLNPCDSFKYRFDNLSTSRVSLANVDFIWDFGDGSTRVAIKGLTSIFHNYTAPGSYIAKLIVTDTTFCNAPDSVAVTVRVAAFVRAHIKTDSFGCAPYTAQFHNESEAGQTFFWDFGDGQTSTDINPTHLYNNPGTYVVVLRADDPGTCNLTDTDTFTIIVSAKPTADFSFAPSPPVENTPTTFTNLSSPDAVKFKWDFGDTKTFSTTSRADVIHQYRATGTFTACLTATNSFGCADDTCKQVSALISPLIAVPSAFTPLTGDGNSVVYVRGFGIAKMRFIIWDRWGKKVFETNDQDIGWDGKYKGVVQPMEVYAYTLDVEFFDGTKATKKGDITLIR